MSVEIPLRARDGSIRAVALIDDEDAHLADHRWSLRPDGYVSRNIVLPGGRRGVELLHRAVMGCVPGDGVQVDHIHEHSTLDNRRANLRLATPSQNQQNRHVVRSATGHRGVSFHKASGLYQAHAMLHGKAIALGYRATAEEAAALAAAWRAEHMPYSSDAAAAA